MSSSAAAMADSMGHGTFHGLNGKQVKGKVTVGGHAVKLTGFSSDEGPDLHLYLTNGTDEAAVSKGTELGKVGFDKATQTFDLEDAMVSHFTDVVVHCDKAKTVFGAATLSS
ncbi:DM13 domain-containing protein [Flexivirga sp. B27]